jgi:hypothetical protein
MFVRLVYFQSFGEAGFFEMFILQIVDLSGAGPPERSLVIRGLSLDSFGNTALFTFHDPAGAFMDEVIIVGGHDHRFTAFANG